MDFNRIFFIFAFTLLVFAFPVFAQDPTNPIVFEDYETSYFLKDGVLTVEKEILIRNVGPSPVIPGQINFRMYEQRGENTQPAIIKDVIALNNDNEVESTVNTYDTYSDLVVHIWNPLLPDYEYPLSISYDLEFSPRGIFFRELVFPVEETTIPVKDRYTRLFIPKSYSVTYAPSAEISSDSLYKIVDWGSGSEFAIEYTLLPFPRMPFRMVSVFWLSVLVILGALFIFLNMKRSKKDSRKKR
ncbi:MAG: hypothetical protein ACOCUR_00045 [Nanoarchaeota archaeon]